MPVKLYQQTGIKTIPMNNLKDGEIAIIIDSLNSKYVNSIVQAIYLNGEMFYQCIGKTCGHRWDCTCNLAVRKLMPGELIEIT